MQKGAQHAWSDQPQPCTRRQLFGDLDISLTYTLLLIALVKHGALKPLPEFLPRQ